LGDTGGPPGHTPWEVGGTSIVLRGGTKQKELDRKARDGGGDFANERKKFSIHIDRARSRHAEQRGERPADLNSGRSFVKCGCAGEFNNTASLKGGHKKRGKNE